jgi:lysyl-tRNA synthetase class I
VQRVGWALSRDVSDPTHWVETFRTRDWHELQRGFERLNLADSEAVVKARSYHTGAEPPRVDRAAARTDEVRRVAERDHDDRNRARRLLQEMRRWCRCYRNQRTSRVLRKAEQNTLQIDRSVTAEQDVRLGATWLGD